MKRRKFIQYASLGGTSFVINLGVLNSQKSNALLLIFLIKSAPGLSLLNTALGGLTLAAFASGKIDKRTQQWFDKRLDAQLAQREFLRRQFQDIAVAEVNQPQYNYVSWSIPQRKFRQQSSDCFS